MKIVAFNGSPKKEGNTYMAIKIVVEELKKEGIESEIVHVGDKLIRGCLACNMCGKNKNEKCFIDDPVNEWIQKMKNADGMLLGSPVHFASISATMKAFLDRAFFVASANGGLFRHKIGAALVAVRRSGGVTAFNQLMQYLNFAEILIPASNYWNVIHGTEPGEVLQDQEGVQIMRVLGRNMAWLLKLAKYGKGSINEPSRESRIFTNFIH